MLSWFFNKNDPVNIFKKQLQDAVIAGDTDVVRNLMNIQQNLPPKTYSKALEYALKNNQVQIVDVIVRGKSEIPVARYHWRDVVLCDRQEMFRALHGCLDFQSLITVTENSTDLEYKLKLRCMEKDLENAILKEQISGLKNLLLEKNEDTSPAQIEEKIKKIENKGEFRL